MARILALDYGAKRTGVAVTDELQIIASGLTTVPTPELFDFLKKYFATENVTEVVIGMPRQMDDTPFVEAFCQKFAAEFPTVKLTTVDERFTSKMAFQTMIDSGLSKKKRQDKGLIDEIAATIILRDYLSRKMF
jgi:putative Holliday junction resolvase